MWKLRKFTLTLFWQNFRENNTFTEVVTKELISRFFFGESEFFVFPHCDETSMKMHVRCSVVLEACSLLDNAF